MWPPFEKEAQETMGSAKDQEDEQGAASLTQPRRSPANDIWVAVPTRAYHHLASGARDAHDLLRAIQANIDGLRAGVAGPTSAGHMAQNLRDIEASCERLNHILEDAMVGAQRDGLSIQRSSLSLTSVLDAAMRQVSHSAAAKRMSFELVTDLDVAASLDRTLLTRALVKLMDRIVRENEAGAEIDVHCRVEQGDIDISFYRRHSSKSDPASLRRPPASGTVVGAPDRDSDLEFCRLVAECHGGTLAVPSGHPAAAAALYRIDLPWVPCRAT